MAKRDGLRTGGLALAGVLMAPFPVAAADPAAVAEAESIPMRILVANTATRASLAAAGHGAAQRLGSAECARIVTDFSDAEGLLLADRLAAAGQTPASWVGQVVFVDGQSSGYCRSRVMAFTEPGSRVVRVCPSFGRAQKRDPRLAETVLIHELLHTLGLEEGPPSSLDITRRVKERCGV